MAAPIITALYVPGDRPDRFGKALSSWAQMVIVDLEDSVAPERKRFARRAVGDWLVERAGAAGPLIQVRVNVDRRADVEMLAEIEGPFELRLPKVESCRDLDSLSSCPGGSGGVTATIETARGVVDADEIANHPLVSRLAIGDADLASDLGAGTDMVLDHAHLRVLFSARAAGLPAPMMSVYPDIADLDGLRTDTIHGRRIGMIGRAAIHPRQLAVISDVFRPSPTELEWAHEVLEAVAAGGVTTLGSGEMVDPAMAGRAELLVAIAAAVERTSETDASPS